MPKYKCFYLLLIFWSLALNLKAMDPAPTPARPVTLSLCDETCGGFTANKSDPLDLIEHLAKYHLKTLLSEIVHSGVSLQNDAAAPGTSCVNTFIALAFMLLHHEEVGFLIESVTSSFKGVEHQRLDGSNLTYEINLFDGYLNYKIYKIGYENFYALGERYQEKIIDELLSRADAKFLAVLEPLQADILKTIPAQDRIEGTKKRFDNMEFTLNDVVVAGLHKTILQNNKKLKCNRSFVYFIVVHSAHDGIHHACVLVQSLEDGRPLFRRYQSWINAFTLSEEIKNITKGWNLAELEVFLSSLTAAYSPKNHHAEINLQACFGHDAIRPRLLCFDNSAFKGLVLSFFAFPFKPSDCTYNVEQFLSAHKRR